MGSVRCRIVIALLAIALAIPLSAFAQSAADQQPAAAGGPQVAQPESGGVNWKGAGMGAAALVANVGYIPAKTVYAILGGITGGVGYALTGGNQQAANTIWRSSLGGDYVVTPDMLSGKAPIHFSGPAGPAASGTSSSSSTSAYPQPYTGSSSPSSSVAPPAASGQELSSNTAAPAAAAAPEYPNTTASAGSSSGLGAPPYSASSRHSSHYSSSSIGSTHITTSVVSEPADSGAGPVQ
jgi:hypothetical protein